MKKKELKNILRLEQALSYVRREGKGKGIPIQAIKAQAGSRGVALPFR
jgi:hypothetical protein